MPDYTPPSGGGAVAEASVTNLVADLALKAPLASPTFTGSPAAPSPTYADNSTKLATTAYADANKVFQVGILGTNPDLIPSSSGASAVTTALLPTFTPIRFSSPTYDLVQLGVFAGAGVAASTVGIAVYTISYSAASTFSCTLVAQLNAGVATTSSGTKKGAVTAGAAGSGAGTVTLNAATTQYVIGVMASTVTTLTLRGVSGQNGWGLIGFSGSGSGTARASTTDWPASFDQTYGGATTSRVNWSCLVNADGVNWV